MIHAPQNGDSVNASCITDREFIESLETSLTFQERDCFVEGLLVSILIAQTVTAKEGRRKTTAHTGIHLHHTRCNSRAVSGRKQNCSYVVTITRLVFWTVPNFRYDIITDIECSISNS
jgi:hypothetical protein